MTLSNIKEAETEIENIDQNQTSKPGILVQILILAVILGLASIQIAESSEPNAQLDKPDTPARLVAANAPKSAEVLRHIDPLDADRAYSSHRGKNPHRELTAEQEISVALQHYQEGRKPEAMVSINQAIAKYPESAKLYDVRATMALQNGETKEALADIEKAVLLDSKNPIYLVNRSQLYLKFHREEQALDDLNKAIELNADLVPARFNRGSLLAYQGKNEEAIKDFDQCIALNPHLPAPYFNRGSVYKTLGKKDLAVKDMENFIQIANNEKWKKSAQDLLKAWNEEDKSAKATQ